MLLAVASKAASTFERCVKDSFASMSKTSRPSGMKVFKTFRLVWKHVKITSRSLTRCSTTFSVRHARAKTAPNLGHSSNLKCHTSPILRRRYVKCGCSVKGLSSRRRSVRMRRLLISFVTVFIGKYICVSSGVILWLTMIFRTSGGIKASFLCLDTIVTLTPGNSAEEICFMVSGKQRGIVLSSIIK